jgi:hypothetical protein
LHFAILVSSVDLSSALPVRAPPQNRRWQLWRILLGLNAPLGYAVLVCGTPKNS